MAEPGEIPPDPTDPYVGPSGESEPARLAAGKRRRDEQSPLGEENGGGESSAAKRRAKAQDVLFRIVVPSKQIGKVIGREGCRIQKIREDTKATVKIADAVAVSSRLLRD